MARLLRFGLLLLLTVSPALTGCTAYSRFLRDADAYAKAGNFEEAVRTYELAIASSSSPIEARAGLAKARAGWAATFIESGEAARRAGKLDEATTAFLRAQKVDPDGVEAPALLAQTLEQRVALGRSELTAGRLEAALAHMEAVLRVSPRHAAASAGREETRIALAQRAFARGEAYEKDGKLGNALIEYTRADLERPGATPGRERAEEMRRKLRDEITFYVVSAPVEDRSQSPDIALRLGAGRLAALFPPALPVKVVTAVPFGPAAGVKLRLQLERVLATREKRLNQRVQEYVAGMMAVPNPKRVAAEKALLKTERALEEDEMRLLQSLRAFLDGQNVLTSATGELERCRERTLGSCREALDDCNEMAQRAAKDQNAGVCDFSRCAPALCNAETDALSARKSEVDKLRSALDAALSRVDGQRREVQRGRDTTFREPLTVEKPLRSEFVYDVELHRVLLRASVTSEMDDLVTPSAAPAPMTQDHLVIDEDVTHRGYDRYGVLTDPLELKGELELRVEAGDKALGEIHRQVRGRFDVYRDRLVDDARRGIVRPSAEEVAEKMVRALLVTIDAPPKDLLDAISRGRGIRNPLAILGLGPTPPAKRLQKKPEAAPPVPVAADR